MQNTSHVAVRHIGIDSALFHDLQVVQREKAAVGAHWSRLLATLALHPVHHRHQQPGPVVAPLGTGVTMFVGLQLVGEASAPLKETVLLPCAAPKFVPVIVTVVPTGPEVGE